VKARDLDHLRALEHALARSLALGDQSVVFEPERGPL